MEQIVFDTPALKYTGKLAGLYNGDLPDPTTVYTNLINDILNSSTTNSKYKDLLTRFIYSLYVSDLHDPYPRNNICKLLYWKIHGIRVIHNGIYAEATVNNKLEKIPLLTDLIKIWYFLLFEEVDYAQLYDSAGYALRDSTGAYIKVLEV